MNAEQIRERNRLYKQRSRQKKLEELGVNAYKESERVARQANRRAQGVRPRRQETQANVAMTLNTEPVQEFVKAVGDDIVDFTMEEVFDLLNAWEKLYPQEQAPVMEQQGVEESKSVEPPDEEKPKKAGKTTKEQREKIIKRLAKVVGAEVSETNVDWLLDDKVEKYIESRTFKDNTKRTYFAEVVAYLKEFEDKTKEIRDAIDRYSKLMYKYIDDVKHTREQNTKSESDVEKMFNWDEMKLLKKKRPLNPLDTVVYELYTSMPPRRNEYARLRLVKYKSKKQIDELDKGINWLITTATGMNVRGMILNTYKTSNTYGQWMKMSLPKPLKDAFKKYLATHTINEGDLIFPKYDTSPKWTTLVQSVFQQATGKSAGVDAIRKSFVTSKERSGRLSQAKRKELARDMGTSLEAWHTDYVKID